MYDNPPCQNRLQRKHQKGKPSPTLTIRKDCYFPKGIFQTKGRCHHLPAVVIYCKCSLVDYEILTSCFLIRTSCSVKSSRVLRKPLRRFLPYHGRYFSTGIESTRYSPGRSATRNLLALLTIFMTSGSVADVGVVFPYAIFMLVAAA